MCKMLKQYSDKIKGVFSFFDRKNLFIIIVFLRKYHIL